MPSEKKTPLGFSQWEGADTPVRQDFNGDNLLVDALLQGKADVVEGKVSPMPTAADVGAAGMEHGHPVATVTTAGFLSAEDKVKLDSAGARETGATILEKLRAVDGAGSGLDADTVDGLNAGQFSQYIGMVDAAFLNNSSYTISYIADLSEGATLGLPPHWWHILYLPHFNNNGHGAQIAVPLNDTGDMPYFRTSANSTWSAWKRFADGGNANYANASDRSQYLRTFNAGGVSHGDSWLLQCKHNVTGDGRFRMVAGDGNIEVGVNFANYADGAGNANRWGGLAVSRLTQAQYDALGYKDGNTVYLIVG